jgi:hypothetical protein
MICCQAARSREVKALLESGSEGRKEKEERKGIEPATSSLSSTGDDLSSLRTEHANIPSSLSKEFTLRRYHTLLPRICVCVRFRRREAVRGKMRDKGSKDLFDLEE